MVLFLNHVPYLPSVWLFRSHAAYSTGPFMTRTRHSGRGRFSLSLSLSVSLSLFPSHKHNSFSATSASRSAAPRSLLLNPRIMSRQSPYQLDRCVRGHCWWVIVRQGPLLAAVPRWFVSRFVPLFPLAIHMQSQGLYARRHALTHTRTHT